VSNAFERSKNSAAQYSLESIELNRTLNFKNLCTCLQAGNIYIVDYEILEGVPTSSDQLYLTAPLCLLYKNRLDQIVPIAIQVSVPYQMKTYIKIKVLLL